MPELFADTSGWGNLVDPTQPFHTLAANIYRAARGQGRKVVTTNYILRTTNTKNLATDQHGRNTENKERGVVG